MKLEILNQKFLISLSAAMFVVIIVLVILLFLPYSPKEELTDECEAELVEFDTFIKQKELLITDSTALCYGMNMVTDFSKLTPRLTTAKLVNLKQDGEFYTLTFEGESSSSEFRLPANSDEVSKLEPGNYYSVDINNICRYFFIMADSRYPSPINETFTSPEKISCAK